MTVPPQTNGQLTAVQGGGYSEDYTRPEGTPLIKWAGVSEVYVDDRLRSTFNSGNGLDRVRKVIVYLDAELPVDIEVGDTLVYNYNGKQIRARIQNLSDPTLPGAPSILEAGMEAIRAD